MKKMVSMILAIALALALSTQAFAAGNCKYAGNEFLLSTGHCNATNVNVRTGPGTSYSSLGTAQKNEIYYEFQNTTGPSSSNWCHVHGKYIGWMYAQYYTADHAARIEEVL